MVKQGINYPAKEVSSVLIASMKDGNAGTGRGTGTEHGKNRGLEKEVDGDKFPVAENDK